MGLDQRELDDDTVERDRSVAVVYRGDGVMALGDRAAQDQHDRNDEWSAHVRDTASVYFVSSHTICTFALSRAAAGSA